MHGSGARVWDEMRGGLLLLWCDFSVESVVEDTSDRGTKDRRMVSDGVRHGVFDE